MTDFDPDALARFARATTEHLSGRGPNPNAPPPRDAAFGGGDEGVGWRPEAEYPDKAEDDEELAEDVDEGDDAEGAPVWARPDDEEANAAAAAVMESLSDEDAAAIEAGDVALWEQRFREAFPDWDDEAADGDEEDAVSDWVADVLASQPLSGRDVTRHILEAEGDLYYADGEVVDRAELLAWMASAPTDAWLTWAKEAGWDPDLRPGIDDLPQELAIEITQAKLDERVAAVRDGRAHPI
jgi:hypothetical protein